MNCPNNTYYSCNSCCSNPCGCKKTTTTTSTTTISVPCDVNNCEQIIDLQCVVHNIQSECLLIYNNNLLDTLSSLFHKVTGDCC